MERWRDGEKGRRGEREKGRKGESGKINFSFE